MIAGLETALAIWLFVVGACFGSFANVLIARLPKDESIVKPRSRCMACGAQLAWYDNVPLVSWLVLGGRCRHCKARISPRYFLVELVTGALFVAALLRFGWSWPLAQALVFITFLVPLVFIDAEAWILPFELTLPGIALGIALAAPNGVPALKDAALGAGLGFLSFRALEIVGFYAFRKEALGMGDKFLVAMLGAFLGWRVLLGVVLLSSLQGALFGGLRILFTGRAGPQPQGPGQRQPDPAPGTEAPEPEPAPATMTWEFTLPGIPWWKRLLLVPVCLLLQPIPDAPEDEEGEEEEWVPGPTNLPFGPWIGLAGVEILLAGPWLSTHLPIAGAGLLFGGP